MADTNDAPSTTPRRRFLAALPVIFGAILVAPRTLRALAARARVGRPANLEPTLSDVPDGFPRPHYLPGSYRLTYARRQPQGGFGTADEVLLMFGALKTPGPRPMPIQVYLTRDAAARLSGTQEAEPVGASVTVDGRVISAQYWDGVWKPDKEGTLTAPNGVRLSWTTANAHALVTRIGDMTVGLRGFRSSGVTKAELLRVAESIR